MSYKDDILKRVEEIFEQGKELRGTPQKVFSGTTTQEIVDMISDNVLRDLQARHPDNFEFMRNGDYLQPEDATLDQQRLDDHIYIKTKYDKYYELVMMIESRAWVDKPFYVLKRGVVKDIKETIPKTDKVKFAIFAICFDVTDRTVQTQDKTKGYSKDVRSFPITDYGRSSNGKMNYYTRGFNKKTVLAYIDYLEDTFKTHLRNKGIIV